MQNAAIYFYVLLLARGGGVGGGGVIHGIGIGYPNCIHIIKINTQLHKKDIICYSLCMHIAIKFSDSFGIWALIGCQFPFTPSLTWVNRV